MVIYGTKKPKLNSVDSNTRGGERVLMVSAGGGGPTTLESFYQLYWKSYSGNQPPKKTTWT